MLPIASIDTIKAHHSRMLPDVQVLLALGLKMVARDRWVWNPPKGVAQPRITWVRTENGQWLKVEVSLVKFWLGTNARLLTADEIDAAVIGVEDFIRDRFGIEFKMATAVVERVDYCTNFKVDEALPAYLEVAKGIRLPYLHTGTHGNGSTVYFRSKGKTGGRYVMVYDKELEILQHGGTRKEADVARGLLRYEDRIRNTRACKRHAKKLRLPNHTGRYLLTAEAAYKTLEADLKQLGLDRPIVSKADRARLITKAVGQRRNVGPLLGFLSLWEQHPSVPELVALGYYSQSTAYRYRKLLQERGLLVCGERQLPGLQIVPSKRVAKAA